MNRKLITSFDVLIISFVIVLSIVLVISFLSTDRGVKAIVTVDGKTIGSYFLSDNLTKEIKTDYGCNTVVISNKECFVVDANCRDGICVNRGKISKIGESIVCLPHKMIVEIK